MTAVLNIKIPLELGSLVNVVAGLSPGQGLDTYMETLARPGLRLCVLYLTQVYTCVYVLVCSECVCLTLCDHMSLQFNTTAFPHVQDVFNP